MITAKELRIGNYLDLYGAIATLQGADFYHHFSIDVRKLSRFKPIPLTEEWLVDFGFNYDYITANLKDFSVGHYADGFYFIPTNKIDFRIGQELRYVHQLQNLYYSLTGKELIKK